jgi:hypothetical protein
MFIGQPVSPLRACVGQLRFDARGKRRPAAPCPLHGTSGISAACHTDHTDRGRQPSGLKTRCVDAGLVNSLAAGRRGRATNSPPQLGQTPSSTSPAQRAQNVHSNEQILASAESGDRSVSQHSQLGRSWSMGILDWDGTRYPKAAHAPRRKSDERRSIPDIREPAQQSSLPVHSDILFVRRQPDQHSEAGHSVAPP